MINTQIKSAKNGNNKITEINNMPESDLEIVFFKVEQAYKQDCGKKK